MQLRDGKWEEWVSRRFWTGIYNDYFEALRQFEKYLLQKIKNITDQTALRLSLALIATINGQPNLGKAIERLDEDLQKEFLENY